MSLYWDIGCKDCKLVSGLYNLNHGEQRLQELCKQASRIFTILDAPEKPAIVSALESMADMDSGTGNSLYGVASLMTFFKDHASHRILPIDQYHRWLDQCAAGYECPTCKQRQNCVLPHNHEGRHSPV